jgi:hypothetical protein
MVKATSKDASLELSSHLLSCEKKDVSIVTGLQETGLINRVSAFPDFSPVLQ